MSVVTTADLKFENEVQDLKELLEGIKGEENIYNVSWQIPVIDVIRNRLMPIRFKIGIDYLKNISNTRIMKFKHIHCVLLFGSASRVYSEKSQKKVLGIIPKTTIKYFQTENKIPNDIDIMLIFKDGKGQPKEQIVSFPVDEMRLVSDGYYNFWSKTQVREGFLDIHSTTLSDFNERLTQKDTVALDVARNGIPLIGIPPFPFSRTMSSLFSVKPIPTYSNDPKGMYAFNYNHMTPDALDDRIDEWHASDSVQPLHEYLGWSHAEYMYWAETGNVPIIIP